MQAGLASVLRGALLTGLYFAGAVIAVLYLHTPADVSLFWPASGIGFAAAVRFGLRYVLIIPIATLLLHLTLVPVPPGFLPYSVGGNTLATLVATWYVQRRAGNRIHLRTSDGLLLLRGGLLLSIVSSTIGSIGMLHSGMVPTSELVRVLLQWGLGDLLGVTSMGPLLLYLFFASSSTRPLRHTTVKRVELACWVAAVALTLVMASPEFIAQK